MSSETGEAKRKTAETKTMTERASGRRHNLKYQVSSDGAGGEYRTERTDWEESVDISAE